MPLQDIPHTFSSMQLWQMAKPQRQVQQNGAVFPQNWQVRFFIRLLRFSRSLLRRDGPLDCGMVVRSPGKWSGGAVAIVISIFAWFVNPGCSPELFRSRTPAAGCCSALRVCHARQNMLKASKWNQGNRNQDTRSR